MTLSSIKQDLKKVSSKKRAETNAWFFKTGPGEYGEGDVFIGVSVPDLRKVAKKHVDDLSLKDIEELLHSKIHEERYCALEALVMKYEETDDEKEHERIYKLYLRNTKYINNWDLVDTSAEYIVGTFLEKKSKAPLTKLAQSKDLWEKRIAIIATFWFIKQNKFSETLRISKILLKDDHDLIHKAVGWMLREVGNRDLKTEEKFLRQHYKKMPRTMLRYAIEKFPEVKRKRYLTGLV